MENTTDKGKAREWFNSLTQNDKESLAKHYTGKNSLSLTVNDMELIWIQEKQLSVSY